MKRSLKKGGKKKHIRFSCGEVEEFASGFQDSDNSKSFESGSQ